MTDVYGLNFSVHVRRVDRASRRCYGRTITGFGHLSSIVLSNSRCHLRSPCRDRRTTIVCTGSGTSGTILFTFSVRPECTRSVRPLHLRNLGRSTHCRLGRVGLIPNARSELTYGNGAFSKRFLVGMNVPIFSDQPAGDRIVRVARIGWSGGLLCLYIAGTVDVLRRVGSVLRGAIVAPCATAMGLLVDFLLKTIVKVRHRFEEQRTKVHAFALVYVNSATTVLISV